MRKVPELKLPQRRRPLLEPTVVWKSKDSHPERSSSSTDVVVDGHGKKVSLLKDWREKFKIVPSANLSRNQPGSEAVAENRHLALLPKPEQQEILQPGNNDPPHPPPLPPSPPPINKREDDTRPRIEVAELITAHATESPE